MGGPNATPTAETKASQTKRPSRIALPPERVAVCGRRRSYAYATRDGRGAEKNSHQTFYTASVATVRKPPADSSHPNTPMQPTADGVGDWFDDVGGRPGGG